MLSNSCTLSCSYCTNYSDYNMKGVLEYSEFVQWADAWSKRLRFDCFGFIGGEPMIHPQLTEFIEYSRRELTDSTMLVTNATLWHKWPDFVEFAKRIKNVHIKFSIHQPGADYTIAAIDNVLAAADWKCTHPPAVPWELSPQQVTPEQYYNAVKGKDWPNYTDFCKDRFRVAEHIEQEIKQMQVRETLDNFAEFIQHRNDNCRAESAAAVDSRYIGSSEYTCEQYGLTFSIDVTGSFTKTWQGRSYYDMKPYANDPAEAHKICTQTYCPLLYKGRLYKCSSVALLDRVLADHNRLDDPDWKPYLDYDGIGADDSDSAIAQWVNNYARPHKICTMCPTAADNPQRDHFGTVIKK